MTGRRRLGLVAAGATLLGSAPLATIFDTWSWLLRVVLTVVMIAGTAVLTRTLRFPSWAQALGMVAGLLITLTWIFPSGHELLVPTPATLAHFGDLIQQAGDDTRAYAVPVPDRDGLLFVATLGIGVVAIVVDLLTAVFRRPALAGLPMLAIYSIPVAVYLDSVPVTPFIIGACGYLWLLVADNVDRVRRFGRRFTGDGRDVDVWEPSPLASAGRRLGLAGVLVAVLLPLIVPTVNGGLLSQLTQGGSGAGGGLGKGGGQINLFAKLSGQLNQTTTVNLLKVRTDEKDPFYLRFGVADLLSNDGFSNQPPGGNTLKAGSLPDPHHDGATDQVAFQQHHADIEVSDLLRQSMAPMYSNPIAIKDLSGNWAYDPNQQVLYSNRSNTGKQKYSIDYLRALYTPAQLRTAPALGPDDPMRKLFTAHPDNKYVDTLVAGLVKGKTNDYDKIRAIYEFFSRKNNFNYSVSTQSTGNLSDIEAFLRNKTGYCQQYAAAMAWMVRDAGIPSRVAFGFTRGTPQDNGAYVITNRNAHAWTEVYLQGFGWVPFDATPAGSVAGASRSNWAPDTDRTATPTASATTAPVAGASASAAAAGTGKRPNRADDGSDLATGGTFESDQQSWTGLIVGAVVATMIALLLVPALRRVLLRRQRHAATVGPPPATSVDPGIAGPSGAVTGIEVSPGSAQARADAHAAWDELIDTMVDFQFAVDPTETPRLTAQRLVKEALLEADAAGAAELLGTAEERARYARQPMQGAELTTALRRVRAGLAHSTTGWVRLRAALFPPSILLSWRLGLAEAGTRTMEAAASTGDFLTRFNPRRLLPRGR
ncbi:transglutaminase [Actinoplanes sp. SE50]|uniref:transglutaminase TgpA family protein n=1 Tax=unclassified Actinoplanes TaxID=2626549 RepID=UPI00023ECC39|nr:MULTISPECIES: DUF3488 and transglutaminase-like domain-containing protein [unclassified Actinoplanes]AEV82642.1 Peptide-N(4)-(N-acetyl-beta- glucosaminyl)asparagine amidase [Actinoplanes sp. SE50/110]ATO81038.1 transglutaminase [Actinoplanes sp. SE50]SLL98445.1 transglutaminase [Actinoplanes sp. SE50/110]